MKRKQFKSIGLAKALVTLLVVHLIFSLTVIFFAPPLGSNGFIDIYRRYLLPGPFFSEGTIDQTHLLYLSWKEKEEWQSPINPTLNHFKDYFSTWNPSHAYKIRLERSIYENWQMASEPKNNYDLNFEMNDLLKYYMGNHDLPEDYDSVRIIFLRQTSRDFDVRTDTIQTLEF